MPIVANFMSHAKLPRWVRLRDRIVVAWQGSEIFPALVSGGLFCVAVWVLMAGVLLLG
jgi:hypothetical protein